MRQCPGRFWANRLHVDDDYVSFSFLLLIFQIYSIDSSTTELMGGLPKVLNLNPLLLKLNRPIYLQLSDRSELLVRRCEGLLL